MDKMQPIDVKPIPQGPSAEELEKRYHERRAKLEEEARAACHAENMRRKDPEWVSMRMMNDAGIPIRFLEAKASHFPGHLMPYFNEWMNGKSGFVSGDTGTGKTHLAAALIRHQIMSGEVKYSLDEYNYQIYRPAIPRFISSPALLVEIRGTFGRGDDTNAVIDKYAKCHSLVLDDLGAEKTSDWSMEVLYLIVDQRYSHMKQLLVTSNLNIGQIAMQLGDRIASRLAGLGFVLTLEGEDKRLSK